MTVAALLVVPGPASPEDTGRTVWADVHGRSLLWHAVHRLAAAGVTRTAVIVSPADASRAQALDPELAVVVAVDPVVGLRAAVERLCGGGPENVLVHDPTRAFPPVAMIHRVLEQLHAGAAVVVPTLPVVDTIRSVGDDGRASRVVDRDRLQIVQTPQGFSVDALRGALRDAGPGTDVAARAVAAGAVLTTVPGHPDAARVLTAADLDHARRTLAVVVAATPTDDPTEDIDD